MSKLIYEDITYKLIGIAYNIDSIIGYGQKEKIYADAYEKLLKKANLPYQREFYCPIKIDGELIAKRYFDFLIDYKIIIEIKSGDNDYRQACSQIFRYLKLSGLKLGLVIRFTKNGAKIKRIPNIR